MASKFMAFEGVASTSMASDLNNEDAHNERIEMNASQYPNYQSNQNHEAAADSHPYGAVDEEDDLNENLEEKTEKDVGYRKFIYNNSEQFKSICGGLLLLMGSGIHIVWGIFRVFYLYQCGEERTFSFCLVIWSWYIGAIIGNCCAGFVIPRFRKGHLYLTGAGLLIASGIFLMFSSNITNVWLLISRIIGGFTQGLIYVVVVVHASENATKEFREFLMLIVGAVLNYSILLSVLAFFHTEGLIRTGFLNGLCLSAFGLCTLVITSKHATETVPFILLNNGSELDALQTVGKLKKKPIAARSVHHDFLTLKNQVQDEIEHYGTPDFRKVLLPENRKSLIFCCYGRLCSILSFNLPLIVMILLFLRQWADTSLAVGGHSHHSGELCEDNQPLYKPSNLTQTNVTLVESNVTIVQPADTDPTRTKRDTAEKVGQPNQAEIKSNGNGEPQNPKEKATDKLISPTEPTQVTPTKPTEPTKVETIKATEPTKMETAKATEPTKVESTKPTEPTKPVNSPTKPMKNPPEKGENSAKTSPKPVIVATTVPPPEIPNAAAVPFVAHFLLFLHHRELTLVLLAWFIFGTVTAAVLYTFNLKRFIYYTACVLGSVLAFTGLFHKFTSMSSILHICLIIYFNYVTIPLDVFGHCMLAEAFPITLKAYSVASVSIIEHLVHIIVITLYLYWFHTYVILFMCIVAFVSYEIARNLPQRANLPLAEARDQYQNINLLLFSEPKTDYNQQQDFI